MSWALASVIGLISDQSFIFDVDDNLRNILPYFCSHFQILVCLYLVERPQKQQYCTALPVK